MSRTPSCDGWFIWPRGTPSPQVKLSSCVCVYVCVRACVCVCVYRLGRALHWAVWVMTLCRWEGEPSCYFTSMPSLFVSIFLRRPHLFFFLLFFFPPSPHCGSLFSPLKSVWVSRNLRQLGGERRRSLLTEGLYRSILALLPKLICARFSAFEV